MVVFMVPDNNIAMKKIANAIFGTASEVDSESLTKKIEPMLVDGELIVGAFKLVRDLVVFTDRRLILVDKQGVTGKKTDYHSVPYRSISQFSIETAGNLDVDSELKVWIGSSSTPIKKEFRRGTNMVAVQKLLASCVLG